MKNFLIAILTIFCIISIILWKYKLKQTTQSKLTPTLYTDSVNIIFLRLGYIATNKCFLQQGANFTVLKVDTCKVLKCFILKIRKINKCKCNIKRK